MRVGSGPGRSAPSGTGRDRPVWGRLPAGSVGSGLRLDVRGLLALRAGGYVEGDALVFGQRFETLGVDCREVREQVFIAVVRFDEAEAFCVVEPFHRASCHIALSRRLFELGSLPPRAEAKGIIGRVSGT